MIIPYSHTFQIIAGTTFDFRFQYMVGPQGTTNPVDLSSSSLTWRILSPDQSTQLESYTSTNAYIQTVSGVYVGSTSNDPKNGLIDLVLSASDTGSFSWATAFYSLDVTTGGVVVPLLVGYMTIS